MVMDKTALKVIQVAPILTLKTMPVIGTNIILLHVIHIMEVLAQEAQLLSLALCAVHVEVEPMSMLIIRQVIHGSLVLLGHQTQPDPVLAKS